MRDGSLDPAAIAGQIGHSVQTLMATYTHVIAELRSEPKIPGDEQIRQAREARKAA
ncbi:MAG TPA: hypothetical protein VFR97_11940 [Capillimicrobium sp.]|nr:hypothetical protein [Capillimicrobium sp.]